MSISYLERQPKIESIDFEIFINQEIEKVEEFAFWQIGKKVQLTLPVRFLRNIRDLTVNPNERAYIKFLQQTQGSGLFIFPKPFIEECSREVDFYLYRIEIDNYGIELCSGKFVELTTARQVRMERDCRKFKQVSEIQEAVGEENLEVIFREQQEQIEIKFGVDLAL